MRSVKAALVFSVICAAILGVGQTAKPPAANHLRFSADMLDKSIDPCTDFYAYVCSKWQAQNPIPSDRPAWGRFNELQDRGETIVPRMLEKNSKDDPSRSPIEQKIGDYY